MSADAQAYFGTRPGLTPGRRRDVRWDVRADGVAAAHSFWAVPAWVWVAAVSPGADRGSSVDLGLAACQGVRRRARAARAAAARARLQRRPTRRTGHLHPRLTPTGRSRLSCQSGSYARFGSPPAATC